MEKSPGDYSDVRSICVAFNISITLARTLNLLLNRSYVSAAELEDAIGSTSGASSFARVTIHRLRLGLHRHRVKIETSYGSGWFIRPDEKDRVLALLEPFGVSHSSRGASLLVGELRP
jgi:hypothetical protein